MKKQNGITLVALVITIIVLLILAGITINLVLGDNGILNTAKNAGKNYMDAQKNEENMLQDITNTMDEIIAGTTQDNRPLDEVEEWLKCINYADTTIQLEEIVTNEALLNRLMNSQKAVDYMILSQDKILKAVTDSELAMKCLANSSYAMDNVIQTTKWRETVLGSANAIKGLDQSSLVQIPQFSSDSGKNENITISENAWDETRQEYSPNNMFDGNSNTGFITKAMLTLPIYLQYDFTNEVWPYKITYTGYDSATNRMIELPTEILASNDGINFIKIGDIVLENVVNQQTFLLNATNKYRYIRFNFTNYNYDRNSTNNKCIVVRELQVNAK